MIETKIIFLDIDSPIATERTFNGEKFKIGDIQMPYPWDKDCVEVLIDVLYETKAKIVLSSDWRKFYKFDEFKTIMNYYGINPHKLIGFTDNIPYSNSMYESNRTIEINKYLDVNRLHDNKYCVIDDMLLDTKNFVHIQDCEFGIAAPGIKEKILNYLR